MRLIDSHCHFDFPQFDADREAVLKQCLALGIDRIVLPGVRADSWQTLLTQCSASPHLFAALGLHPLFMIHHQADALKQLRLLLSQYPIVAIGEIGLDFYIADHDKTAQLDLFEQQLVLAAETQLPVILHIRKAHDQVLQSLKKYNIQRGIVHAFNGSQQQAEQYIKQGFLLGVGGVITHTKARRLRQLFSDLPLTALALETDAPDMPLAGQVGTRNSPTSIATILQCFATLRTESEATIAQQTTVNVETLLNLPQN